MGFASDIFGWFSNDLAIDLGTTAQDLNNQDGMISSTGLLSIAHLRDLNNQNGVINSKGVLSIATLRPQQNVVAVLVDDSRSMGIVEDGSTREAQAVNALSNLRPQHLTDALLVRPIDQHGPGVIYVQSEFFESEKDPAKLKPFEEVKDELAKEVRAQSVTEKMQMLGDQMGRFRKYAAAMPRTR